MEPWPSFPESLLSDAERLLASCRRRGFRLATAESCTGGLIAGVLTEIAGSSDVFTHGFVTYANAAKMQMLDVSERLLEAHGAVSEPVARAMAEGACRKAGAGMAIAATGIAGPGGGSVTKPVGLVYLAVASEGGETRVEECRFTGDRHSIRMQTVAKGLMLANSLIGM